MAHNSIDNMAHKAAVNLAHKIVGNMTYKIVVATKSKVHSITKDAHKTVKIATNMIHNASHSCTLDHDEMKNSF